MVADFCELEVTKRLNLLKDWQCTKQGCEEEEKKGGTRLGDSGSKIILGIYRGSRNGRTEGDRGGQMRTSEDK